MTSDPFRPASHPLRFPIFVAAAAFLSWTLLRIVLWVKFHPAGASGGDMVKAFAAGLHVDLAMAMLAPVALMALCGLLATLFSLPLWLLGLAMPAFRGGSAWRRIYSVLITLGLMTGVFLLITEFYFFEEFESRFNTVAIDYLIYPHEVVTNIWESYPLPAIIAACGIGGGLAAWLVFRRWQPDWRAAGMGAAGVFALLGAGVVWVLFAIQTLYGVLACAVLAAILVAAAIWFLKRREQGDGRRGGSILAWLAVTAGLFVSVRPEETGFSHQRVVNELANNGFASGIRAAWSRHLDYTSFYATLPRGEAFRRARQLLAAPGVNFAGPEVPPEPQPDASGKINEAENEAWLDAARLSIARDIPGDAAKPKRNVCIILVESLGSEFLGCLGGKDKDGKPRTLTPELDKLAAEDGMLFTNIFADGNRTIRGFEAVYSSIPPLPGDSILARDKTDKVETLGRVLKRDGYNSLFLYGGRGSFDYISSYVLPNGWDNIVEQKDYKNPAHVTAWGVSDEDLFHRGIEEMRALHQKGEPFLVSYMTVTNHKPFTFPQGRLPEEFSKASRNNAVRYSDWALGDFFRRCKQEAFWKDTVFLVAGDHGARVYGSQTIPMQSYRVPALILGPCVVPQPQRVDTPGCQLDLGPTLLGLIGRPYRSLFFGHDLLLPGASERSRSLMHHNRSIAVYHDGRQVVYGLNKLVEYWQGDAAEGKMERVMTPDDTFRTLQDDGAALFRCADELYSSRRFILE